jgi:4'-phosphopantetheinyl transferase
MSDSQPANDLWLLPRGVVELNDDEVHVWRLMVAANESQDESLAALLSADERQRAKQFRFAKDQRLYTAAHAAMRSLLAFYLRVPGEGIHLAIGANGKPWLAQPIANRLQFNLSHSHEFALVAVARNRAVGIDVEWAKDFAFQEVAQRFFTAKEAATLSALPQTLQRAAFYKCWTAKEAFLKAKGTGLSGQLDEVQILTTAEGVVKIDANVPGWSLVELRQVSGYEAALVIEGSALAVRCYRWQAPLVLPAPTYLLPRASRGRIKEED